MCCTHKNAAVVAVRNVSPSPSGSQQTQAHDLVFPEQPPPPAHKRNKHAPLVSTPSDSSPIPRRELVVVPHPNPLRNVPTGGRLPSFQSPRPAVATVTHQLPASAAGSIVDTSQQSPTLPYPTFSQGQHPTFLPQSSHHQPAAQEQISQTPQPSGDVNLFLDPKEIESIPCPSKISQKNLRAEMKLDASNDAKAYYSKIRRIVRGHMNEHFWMNWISLQDNRKDILFKRVYNDPRIPIIKRYRDNWATDEIAKTIASGRRKDAYASGDAEPPPKYAYNAINSSKRDPKAPRGRWNSVSQSVSHEGKKGKRTRRTKERAQDISLGVPEQPDPGNVDVYAAETCALPRPASIGPQDAGPSQPIDLPVSPAFRLNETSSMYHSFQLSPSTLNDDVATNRNSHVMPPGTQHTLQLLPYPTTEHERTASFPTPMPQQTPAQRQHLPLSMDSLYTFDVQYKHSEDEDDSYGFEN